MRILVLNGGVFASVEGAVVRFKNLIANRGKDDVIWVDPVTSRDYYKTENLDKQVPPRVTVIPGFKVPKNPVTEVLAREKHFLNAAKQALKEGRVDVCVFFNAWGTYRARKYLRSKGVPVVFDYIDLMGAFRESPAERLVASVSTGEALSSSDLVIVTAEKLAEHARMSNANVTLIPNGVDVKSYARVKSRPMKLKHPNVGFVGGFGNWTDFDKVLFAAKAHPRVTFYFIGDGVERPRLLAAQKQLPNVVVSEQFVPYQQGARYVAGFDACVIPFKINELTDAVCPLKLFEFWSLKKPVIVSPTYELKRIIQNDEALFASAPEEWSQKIAAVLRQPKLAKRLGEMGSRLAWSYDWNTLSEHYRRALANAGIHR